MVRINSEHKDGQTEISSRRLMRSMEKLKKEYHVREAGRSESLVKEPVLNGDPPSLMLWGEE